MGATFGALAAFFFSLLAAVSAVFFPGAEDDLVFMIVAGTVWGTDLAVSLSKAAEIYRVAGHKDRLLEVLKRGREIMARLVERSPTNTEWKNNLLWFEQQIASVED